MVCWRALLYCNCRSPTSSMAFSVALCIASMRAACSEASDSSTAWYTFQTKADSPPLIGLSIPLNGSTNNTRNLRWTVIITDADAEEFDWTLECSNGQTNGSLGDGNGTKALELTGLKNKETYIVWANATDGNGSSTAWFTFTTKRTKGSDQYGTEEGPAQDVGSQVEVEGIQTSGFELAVALLGIGIVLAAVALRREKRRI